MRLLQQYLLLLTFFQNVQHAVAPEKALLFALRLIFYCGKMKDTLLLVL